jgi:hypothetical protein
MNALNDQLLAAHAAGDPAALATLYAVAADQAEEEDAAGFFLTHAYVFALEAGLEEAPVLRSRLIAMGRETPL